MKQMVFLLKIIIKSLAFLCIFNYYYYFCTRK